MEMATTQIVLQSKDTVIEGDLYMSFELGDKSWKVTPDASVYSKISKASSSSIGLDLRKRLTVHFVALRGAHSAEMAKTPNPTNLIRLIPAEEEPICSP
jgi:hypothetical protein